MESVETVTTGIPVPVAEEAPEPAAADPAIDEAAVDGDGEVIVPAAAADPAADPLAGLLRTGLELLTRLGSAADTGRVAEPAPPPVVEWIRDERGGQSYLKIRMPPPDVMDRVVGALQALLESIKA
jgi:hypothetical protein